METQWGQMDGPEGTSPEDRGFVPPTTSLFGANSGENPEAHSQMRDRSAQPPRGGSAVRLER